MSTLQDFFLNIILVIYLRDKLQFTNSLSKLNISSRNSLCLRALFILSEPKYIIILNQCFKHKASLDCKF